MTTEHQQSDHLSIG